MENSLAIVHLNSFIMIDYCCIGKPDIALTDWPELRAVIADVNILYDKKFMQAEKLKKLNIETRLKRLSTYGSAIIVPIVVQKATILKS